MRIGIISDIHEDIIGLNKAIDSINNYDIDRIVCLGDIVGFEKGHYKYEKTRNAHECVQLIKHKANIVVAGNHDLLHAQRIPHFATSIGFPENWYDLTLEELKHKYEHIFFLYKDEEENNLDKKDKEFLQELNSWEVLNIDSLRMLFSHFIYPDINGNMKIFTTNKYGFLHHLKWMENNNVNISFAGHAHIEGVGIATRKGLKISRFGEYSLKYQTQVILPFH